MDLVMAWQTTLNPEMAAQPTDSALLQSRYQSAGTITFTYTEYYLTSKTKDIQHSPLVLHIKQINIFMAQTQYNYLEN
jgi:hypothetical protein